MTNKVQIGVLGCAKIAREQLIPAMAHSKYANYWGVASRSIDKAALFNQSLQQKKIIGESNAKAVEGYETLLADPTVNAVYNALPNDMHVPFILKAIRAGKHVLCEKPFAMTSAEAKTVSDALKGSSSLVVMESFMYRFHPQWQQVKQWIDSGHIGALRSISAQFCYFNDDPSNIRNRADAGGGALMDVGCYGISVARMIVGEEPLRLVSALDIHPEYGVDNSVNILMNFSNGITASILSNTKSYRSQCVMIEGSRGRILLTHPFYCEPHGTRVVTLTAESGDQELRYSGTINHFSIMLDAFCASILKQQPAPLPLSDSIANMKVIDAAFKSQQMGGWIDLSNI